MEAIEWKSKMYGKCQKIGLTPQNAILFSFNLHSDMIRLFLNFIYTLE